MAKRQALEPGAKTKAAIEEREKIPKRKCIGDTPVRGECNRMFRPKHRFNFLCEACSKYFKYNNVLEE